MLNETIEKYKEVLPSIKDYLGKDIMIGLTDGVQFVGFWEGNKMRAPIQVGDKLKSDDPMVESFRTGKVIDMILPPHIHGFPFRSITAPIKDVKGKIVGTIGIGSSLELLYSIETIIHDINEKLDDGLGQVKLLSGTSEEINRKSISILEVMHNISDTTKQISDATSEISGIASKTQILAINASIEAAHAGNFGVGFSVVAQEMKKLANTSQESSQKIFDLISELSKQVEQNYIELKDLQESIQHQKDSSNQISANIDTSKEASISVLNLLHQ